MDAALAVEKPDWETIKPLYWRGTLSRVAAETRNSAANVNLKLKIDEIFDLAHESGATEDINAIIARRTLWRIVALLLENEIAPPKKAPALAERRTRATILLDSLCRLIARAEPDKGAAYGRLLHAREQHWAGKPDAAAAQAYFDAIDGVMADMTLRRLAQWRALDKTNATQRRQAVVLQADMRQLFSVLYPRLFDEDQHDSWTALTEFTNDPAKMDADYIENVLRKFRNRQLAIAGEAM